MTSTQIALVTGANKGVGLATVRALAQLGVTVLLGSRDLDRGAAAVADLARDGVEVRLLVIDVDDDTSVKAAAQQVDSDYGRLDILINNAGLLNRRPALEVSPDDMRAEFETNVFGLVRVTREMLPLLRRSQAARVVNVSSDSASLAYATEPGSMFAVSDESMVYSASKAAVNMLTVKYANAFSASPDLAHIKVNAVTPGYTATDLNGFRGTKTTQQGAAAAVHWATVGDPGETGGFFDDTGRVPW